MSDSDSDKTSTTVSLCFTEHDDRLDFMNVDTAVGRQSNTQWHDLLGGTSDSEMEDVKVEEKLLGDGSDEDDSLLVIYQETPKVY